MPPVLDQDKGVRAESSSAGRLFHFGATRMSLKAFMKAGHAPTLFAAFLYFDLSFMVWVLLGPLAVLMARDLHLNAAEKGLLVATPNLTGAALRVVMGVLVDHLRPRRAGIIAQLIVLAGLGVAWLVGIHSFAQALVLAVVLGMAGASFAVALPLASRWYPPQYQGAALGIAGAGNSGTVLASLFAPALAIAIGWNNVIGLAALPLAVAFLVYLALAKDAPNPPPPKRGVEYLAVLKQPDAWAFMGFYAVSFGGFVGLSSSLPVYYNGQYGLSPVVAGLFTAACVFSGSMVRPFGGALADRFGGARVLTLVYAVAAAALIVASFGLHPAPLGLGVFVVAMLALGMGNGAVFQLVPQRFGREIGVMTGLVGMAGGVGGFYLASSLGLSKQLTGQYQAGFLIFAALALVALLGLVGMRRRLRAALPVAATVGA
jgi:NNP family nitrate/nitrite transporter-like MFS transporter